MSDDLREASYLYDIARDCTVTLEGVYDSDYARLTELQRAVQLLAQECMDSVVSDFSSLTGLYTARQAASPLPFNHLAHLEGVDVERLRYLSGLVGLGYGQQRQLARDLVDQIELLLQSARQPLGDRLMQIRKENGNEKMLVVPLARGHLEHTKSWVEYQAATGNQVKVGDMRSIRATKRYDRIVVVGPSRWIRPHSFDAPRSGKIHILSYRWVLYDTIAAEMSSPNFDGPTQGRRAVFTVVKRLDPITPESTSFPIPPAIGSPDRSSSMEATHGCPLGSDVMVPRDWSLGGDWIAAVARQLHDAQVVSNGATDEDDVLARLTLLADSHAAYLESSERRIALIIDDDASVSDRARQVRETDVLPGMYLVLRTNASRGYIEDIANRLLGNDAKQLRHSLVEWKRIFRIRTVGMEEGQLSRRLGNVNSKRLIQDARRWGSPHSIGPRDRETMNAIAGLLDRSKDAYRYWEELERIRAAHGQAGQEVRRALNRLITPNLVEQLREIGFISVTLPEFPDVQLSALRVEAKAPGLAHVRTLDLERLFKLT